MNESSGLDAKTKHMRRSDMSFRNLHDMRSKVNGIKPCDNVIEAACLAFECPQRVVVWKEQILRTSTPRLSRKLETKSKTKKNALTIKKSNISKRPDDGHDVVSLPSPTNIPEQAAPPISKEETVILKCIYDVSNRLIETHLCKVRHVPKILMQVLTFYAPVYKHLNKFVIKQCGIDVYTIHELSKILACSLVTEVCLDDSPLPESNYAILLDSSAHLRHLSLCRCKINDEACKQIALKLDHFATAAAKTLQLLNLTSNQITDEGAKYLGLALRSNRTLRYLNVSGNRITDEGAGHIFNVMMQFPLTYQESISRKQRHLDYLKKRWHYLKQYGEKLGLASGVESVNKNQKKSKVSPVKKGTSPPRTINSTQGSRNTKDMRTKAENMVDQFMGPFVDPYGLKDVEIIDGYTHCFGNSTLCYLNLAYNNLQLPSLQKLLEVLKYQNDKQPTDAGLYNVILLGNYLPRRCNELIQINEYLQGKLYKPRKSKMSTASFKTRFQPSFIR